MYVVLQKLTEENDVLYAVADKENPDSDVEVINEADLKLLAIVGLSMETMNGDPVTMNGNELVCDVPEFVEEEEVPESTWATPEELAMFGLDAYSESGVEQSDEGDLGLDDDYDIGDYDVAQEEPEDEGDTDGVELEAPDDLGLEAYGAYDDDDGVDLHEVDPEDEEPIGRTVVNDLYDLLTERHNLAPAVDFAKRFPNIDEDDAKDIISVKHPVDLLKRYYLWFSRRIFSPSTTDIYARFKKKSAADRKKAQVAEAKGDSTFIYGGFVDVGSRDLGYYCTFSHRIRYLHLAWDIDKGGDIDTFFFGQRNTDEIDALIGSPACLIFGLDCIGDFFNIDKECKDRLRNAQKQALDDMERLYKIYTNEDIDEVMHSFDLLDEVVRRIFNHDIIAKTKEERIVSLNALIYYMQFRNLNMIPPKSLVYEIRNCIVGWSDGFKKFRTSWESGQMHFPEDAFYDKSLRLFAGIGGRSVVPLLKEQNKSLKTMYHVTTDRKFLVYLYLFFTYEICGFYKYDPTYELAQIVRSRDRNNPTPEEEARRAERVEKKYRIFIEEGGSSGDSGSKKGTRSLYRMFYRGSIHNDLADGKFDFATLSKLFGLYKFSQWVSDKYIVLADGFMSSKLKLPFWAEDHISEIDIISGSPAFPSQTLTRLLNGYKETLGSEDEQKKVDSLRGIFKYVAGGRDVPVINIFANLSNLANFEEVASIIQKSGHRDTKLIIANAVQTFTSVFAEFDTMYEKLLAWSKSEAEAKQAEYEAAQEEKRRKEAEEQRLKEERLRAAQEAQERIAQNMSSTNGTQVANNVSNRVAPLTGPAPTDRLGVVEYLKNADLSGISGKSLIWTRDNVLKTLIDSGKEPSKGQFEYLQPLYEAVTGVAYTGDGALDKWTIGGSLSDRPDIQDAIAWVKANEAQARTIAADIGVGDVDKMFGIVETVSNSGNISKFQMPWLKKAFDVAEKGRN